MEKSKVSVETIIRTIVLAITMLNQTLVMLGKNPLPFAEDQIYTLLSTLATIGATLWAWWKNNSFTKAAIEADAYMAEQKTATTKDNIENK